MKLNQSKSSKLINTRMAPISYSSSTKCNVRSISLPSRRHPATLKIEDELDKLTSWEARMSPSHPSTSLVMSGLYGLEELYVCLQDFLNMASTRQVLSRHGHDGSAVDEILDASVTVLDICGATRDIVGQVKDHARDLTSAIRRRKWNPRYELSLADYTNFRKKVKREMKRLVATLKQADNKLTTSLSPYIMLDQDLDFSRAVWVLREVNSSCIAVFRSLMSFLSGPAPNPKHRGWQAISRLLVHKGAVGCDQERQEEGVNELDCVDSSLRKIILSCKKGEKIEKMANQINISKQLGDLEVCMGTIEEGLESLFRRLIRSRASLLNIISQ